MSSKNDAIQHDYFKTVRIIQSIENWECVAANYSANQLGNIVPDVLNFYDLPDLVKLIPETRVKIID